MDASISAKGNSSSHQVQPSQTLTVGAASHAPEAVARILVHLARRCQLDAILSFTSVNASFRSTFAEWRGAIGDGFHIGRGLETPVLQQCAASPEWEVDLDFTSRLLSSSASPSSKLALYANVPEPERFLGFAALCSTQPLLLAKTDPNPVDLMLMNLAVLLSRGSTAAVKRFDQLPHLALLRHLHLSSQGRLVQAPDCGELTSFSPELISGLNELSESIGEREGELVLAMLRLKRDFGNGSEAKLDRPYIKLMNAALTKLSSLSSGEQQAEFIDLWIGLCPAPALPRLHLAIDARCKTTVREARMADLARSWRDSYVSLQRLVRILLSKHWSMDSGERKAFLAYVVRDLQLPEEYSPGDPGLSPGQGYDTHFFKLRAWMDTNKRNDLIQTPISGVDATPDGQLVCQTM